MAAPAALIGDRHGPVLTDVVTALALGAKGGETWSNLGNSLHRQGRLDEAEREAE